MQDHGVRVYVASSWRNPRHQHLVEVLRAEGHEVYDFRNPPGRTGFSWHQLDPSLPPGPADINLPAREIITMLDHPLAVDGYESDMGALRWCDVCVLLLPCGRSAHLEAGWAAGAGKFTVGLLADGEPDLMWKMLNRLCADERGVLDALQALVF